MAKTPPAQQESPSVSTAGRLKYADPRSLPSFPSSGLSSDGAAASAAASLGWSNQKPIETWKPDKTSSASAAAVLAKDYKAAPPWEHTADSAGHKAAMLAVGSAGAALNKPASKASHESKGSHDDWGNSAAMLAVGSAGAALNKPAAKSPHDSKGSHDDWGNSAATQAFRTNRPSSIEPTDLSGGSSAATQAFNTSRTMSMKKPEIPATPKGDRSLVAAKGAMSSSRPRSTSSPTSSRSKAAHAAEASAASNALNGATLAHRASMASKPPLGDVGAVSVTTMTRNMFTSHPAVKPEVDEQANADRIHQSAVEMARKMYQLQQKSEQARDGQEEGSDAAQPGQYLNLQDAAYKQAHERLAKLHDEHQQNREYQEYYGKEQSPRRRFSMASKLRRRSSSDGAADDRQRSEKIREQMSMFSSKLSQVDKGKRDKDREALLAAAQRNVKASLHGMDEKVYNDTGKINPTLLSDWELKAQQAAQVRHEARSENKGKIDIGGGRFMSQEEIDAIAAKRVQPALDDINEKAAAERERLAVLKKEEEARREEAEKQKAREREIKDTNKKAKEQEKQEDRAKKLEEKQAEKAKREEEKAVKAEQKRQAKEEKRKSKVDAAPAATVSQDADNADGSDVEEPVREVETEDAQATHDDATRPAVETNTDADDAEHAETQQSKAGESTSSSSKVKGWIKNRFSRGKSIGDQDKKRKSFQGGAAPKEPSQGGSTASLENRPTSMRDVAMAGQGEENLEDNQVREHREAHEIQETQGIKETPSPEDTAGTEWVPKVQEGQKTDETDEVFLMHENQPTAKEAGILDTGDHGDDAKDAGSVKDVSPKDATNDGGDAKDVGSKDANGDSRGVSPVSTPLEGEEDEESQVAEARESRNASMEPPKAIENTVSRTSSSPTRDSRFRENIDQ